MMKIFIIVLACLVVFVLVFFGFRRMMRGLGHSSYESLREPRIRTMEAQKMLVVELKGDPNVVAGKAFGALFKTFYQLQGVQKAGPPPAPRARWPLALDTPKGEWVGEYGLPIPATVEALPGNADPLAKIATWDYGTVAEILHVGPYSAEAPTIGKLKTFITKGGFKIVGDHEEEYLKGPGMFGKGDPRKYYTIIRYRVEKAQPDTVTKGTN